MKKDTLWRWATVSIGIALAMGLWRLGTQPAVAQRAAGGPCCCVGTLDLQRVLQNLDERAEREGELQSFIRERIARIKNIQERIEQLRADLDILPENGPEWRAKREEVLREDVSLRSEQDFLQLFGAEMEARMKRKLFIKIRDAASRYAEREGYAVVITDDSEVPIPQPVSPELTRQVEPAIVARRVIYSSACADLTDDVARMMNVEFAGQ